MRRRDAALCLAIALPLAGCGTSAAIRSTPPPTRPLPTATADVGFAVAVTAQTISATPRPRPTATRFVVPAHAYLRLSQTEGPPASVFITVMGGHLPRSVQLQLGWSVQNATAAVATTVHSDALGNLRDRFRVPASPPGTYIITATLNGAPVASATYRVVSRATLSVEVRPESGSRSTLLLSGRHFVPRIHLLLIAYAMSPGSRPIVLGKVLTGSGGAFDFRRTLRRLKLGQYIVRAWSENSMTAQMAETYFQVVV